MKCQSCNEDIVPELTCEEDGEGTLVVPEVCGNCGDDVLEGTDE